MRGQSPVSPHLGRNNMLQESNQQLAIANRRFADILLQHPYELAASAQER